MKKPKVRVILPTYNWDRFIEKSVESFLSQPSKCFELEAAGDVSTNNASEIVKGFIYGGAVAKAGCDRTIR